MKPSKEEIINAQAAVIAKFRAAALKFMDKVETGRAHSRETYLDLRECVKLADEVRPQ